MQGWVFRKWENLHWWVISISGQENAIKSDAFKISNQHQGNQLAIFKHGRRVQSDFELLQIRLFFSFTLIILLQKSMDSANLIHSNSIALFSRYNYRFTHLGNESWGFTCTTSLGMEESFQYRSRLCQVRYRTFRVHCLWTRTGKCR